MSEPALALIDWGTSSFRLWLVDAEGNVLHDVHSDEGMSKARVTGFDKILEKHLSDLGAKRNVPAVICGMAGAKTGWHQARYLALPTDLDVIATAAVRVPDIERPAYILPGVAKHKTGELDVMRGEETLVMGALARSRQQRALCCLPGTHSKWVTVETGRIVDFRTYMTGDLFRAIASHSILAQSLGDCAKRGSDADTLPLEQRPEFSEAVQDSLARPEQATALLFSVRTRELLRGDTPDQSSARLSGLLIGLELAGMLPSIGAVPVTLISEGAIGACYRRALAVAGIAPSFVDADEAVLFGLQAAGRTLGLLAPSQRISV